jgi:hypothetical protein
MGDWLKRFHALDQETNPSPDRSDRSDRGLSGANGPNGPKIFTVNARVLRHAGVLNTKESARYDAALAELEAAGWLRPHPGRSGDSTGRRRKDWEVNPRLGGDA